jgi:hypothetical protein
MGVMIAWRGTQISHSLSMAGVARPPAHRRLYNARAVGLDFGEQSVGTWDLDRAADLAASPSDAHACQRKIASMRHLIGGLFMLCGAGMAPPAMAEWEYAKWGMTPEQVAAASRGTVKVIPQAQRKRIEEAKMESGAEGTFKDGDLELHVAFSFDTRGTGLVAVGYNVMDAAQNDRLKDWLVRKYGAPRNKGGIPAIGLSTWDWDRPDEIEMNISTGTGAFVLQSKSQ